MNKFFAAILLAGTMFFSVPTVQSRSHKMNMPEGITMKLINAGEYKVTVRIMEKSAFRRYMEGAKRKSHKMRPGSSHYIMLDIIDSRGDKVTQAVAKIKVISPDGNSKQSRAFPIMKSFGADFNLSHKGSYQVMMQFKARGKKYKGGFRHTIK